MNSMNFMNINELFFFKTIQCGKKEAHDVSKCYFYHNDTFDKRRHLLDIAEVLAKYKNTNGEESVDIKDLKVYTNHIGFELGCINKSKMLDGIHRHSISPCFNLYEHKFHILNYKTTRCVLDKFNINCDNKHCVGTHKDEKEPENIQKFKEIYEKLIKSNVDITHREISGLINIITRLSNSYVDSVTILGFICKLNHRKKLGSVINYENHIQSANGETEIPLSIIPSLKKPQNLQDDNSINKSNDIANSTNIEYDLVKLSTNTLVNKCIKTNIYDELKNIPILTKETIYSSIINTDDQIVFLSNSIPKKEELNQLIIAMLNSHNGVIIYGVDVNTNKVTGIKMNSKSRDLFRQSFNSDYKSILIEYENSIKYKFYGLNDPNIKYNLITEKDHKDHYCIIVFKIKKVKDKKVIFDPLNRAYMIKPKFLKKLAVNTEEKIKISDIKLLNMKAYIEIMKDKLMGHYKKEYKLKNEDKEMEKYDDNK